MPILHKQEWLIDTVKDAEGTGNFDGTYHHPYPSAEGGNPTIGYGHKITEDVVTLNGKKIDLTRTPLTDAQALALLEQDIQAAEIKARRQYTQANNPAGTNWEGLSKLKQSILTEIVFNTGDLLTDSGKFEWPKLAKAMKNDDHKEMLAQIDRGYKKRGETTITTDTRRNNLLRKAYRSQLKRDAEPSPLEAFMKSDAVQRMSDMARAELFVDLKLAMAEGKGEERLEEISDEVASRLPGVLPLAEESQAPPVEEKKETPAKDVALSPGFFEGKDGKMFEVIEVDGKADTAE